jgi:hypothetical protein
MSKSSPELSLGATEDGYNEGDDGVFSYSDIGNGSRGGEEGAGELVGQTLLYNVHEHGIEGKQNMIY